MNYKIAFLSEMSFQGKIPRNFINMRTECAWICALNADHYPITEFHKVKDYDFVFIIWPKGHYAVHCGGPPLENIELPNNVILPHILKYDVIQILKDLNNKKICYIQEGACWQPNDYPIDIQFSLHRIIQDSDIIFCHNQHDVNWYKGFLNKKHIYPIPTLMIEDLIRDIIPQPEEKIIVGGNLNKWYGGYQSLMCALQTDLPIYIPVSGTMRKAELNIDNDRVHHLPWISWIDWMKQLSTFKYAIHLMPTVAAGTFSLNCAYFNIPCISNYKLDTQHNFFPELETDVEDVEWSANALQRLINDKTYYTHINKGIGPQSISPREKFYQSLNYEPNWLDYIKGILGK